jgi:hypothetical protein
MVGSPVGVVGYKGQTLHLTNPMGESLYLDK